jgi:hypothetical protein
LVGLAGGGRGGSISGGGGDICDDGDVSGGSGMRGAGRRLCFCEVIDLFAISSLGWLQLHRRHSITCLFAVVLNLWIGETPRLFGLLTSPCRLSREL